MSRKGLPVALSFLALAGPAAAAGTTVSVKPRPGRPSTSFTVSFRAPDATGVHGVLDRYYLVEGSTRDRAGCTSSFSVRAPAGAAGTLLHVHVRPDASTGRWCTGWFHGQIAELAGPVCQKGKLCPLFVTTVRRLASFGFRVVAAR